MTDSPRG
jgi:tRNA U38,U39,U40 pseudouridine synthase TruA